MTSNSERREPGNNRIGLWIFAAASGCSVLAVLLAGVGLVALSVMHNGNPFAHDGEKKLAPEQPKVKPLPGGNKPAFQKMADRLTGRWVGNSPGGETLLYEYRADGSFTLNVKRAGNPLVINGTWRVVGVGADSLGIAREGFDPPGEFFIPGDGPGISFRGPDLMEHTFQNGVLQFAREGSGLKPGQIPPPNEHQKAVTALKLLGADVLRDAGFDGAVSTIRFPLKNANNTTLALLRPLNEVTALLLTDCTQVTDEGLLDLAGLKQLNALSLTGTQVTDAGLVHVAGMTNLVGFECGTKNVRGDGLVHLQTLPKLQSLHLNKGGITDEGLANIRKLTKLTFVDLDDTQISDVGLAHLHGLSKLIVVRAHRTKITDAGVLALKKAVPASRVDR